MVQAVTPAITTQPGTIAGCVTYRPGDGAPIEIPVGPVEVTLAPDSATLSWGTPEGVAGLTAMPLIQFDDYVRKSCITMAGYHPPPPAI